MDTMRDRFTRVATTLLDEDPRIAIVLADIGTDRFDATGASERHPQRVRNVGIREQLMVGVAAGFALEGFRPIAHSYAPFLVERAFEQIKLDLVHQNVGAILVSVGASHDSPSGGRTHQAPGDVALLATLPGFEIQVPGHPDEAESALRRAAETDLPVYVRLAEGGNQTARATPGAGLTVVRQDAAAELTVIAVGPVFDAVLEATAERNANVLYACTVRPFDAATLAAVAGNTDVVLVEPYQAGTSAIEVTRALSDRRHRLLALGVGNPELRRYGTTEEHDRAHGLDADGIARGIDGFVQ